jgi:CBS domain-containing protein/SAM-dependent methyltransferase
VPKQNIEAEVTVREAMSPSGIPSFGEGHLLADVLDEMEGLDIGAVPVVAGDGSFKGLLVRRDGIAALSQTPNRPLTVGEVCRSGVSVGVDEPVQAALRVLQAERVGRVPVVDGNNLVGVISSPDIRSFHEKQRLMGLMGLSPHERSQVRWRAAQPTKGLTWGMEISGEAFIEKAESYGAFGSDKSILEIGPGYGRLLRECLERALPFQKYVAVDISPANVKHLTEQFERSDVDVINGNIETVSLDQCFDAVLSSLTLKHLYPSFEAALRNVEPHLNPGATLLFDLFEGTLEVFSPSDGVTYLRGYSRSEVEAILAGIPLELVAFDYVEHAPGQVRLLVVARKAA